MAKDNDPIDPTTVEPVVMRMWPTKDIKRLQKEAMGLRAKLKWKHLDEAQKLQLEIRLGEVQKEITEAK